MLGTLYTILTAVLSGKTTRVRKWPFSNKTSNLNRVKTCRVGLAVVMVVSLFTRWLIDMLVFVLKSL